MSGGRASRAECDERSGGLTARVGIDGAVVSSEGRGTGVVPSWRTLPWTPGPHGGCQGFLWLRGPEHKAARSPRGGGAGWCPPRTTASVRDSGRMQPLEGKSPSQVELPHRGVRVGG